MKSYQPSKSSSYTFKVNAHSTILRALAILFLCTSDLSAQDPGELRATYGRGVHAFYAGQLNQADQLFSQVIFTGSKDPRVYYFRSMTLLRLGRQYEAESDMRIGASFEAQNPGNQYAISKALQRVQGQGRKTLEKFRRQARLERAQTIRIQTRQRYEQLQQRDDTVLHQDASVNLEMLADPSGPAEPAQRKIDPQKGSESNTKKQPTNVAPSEDDLFGDPTPAEPENDLFDEKPNSDPGEDPFSLDAPAESTETEESSNEEPEDFDPFSETRQDAPIQDEAFSDESESIAATNFASEKPSMNASPNGNLAPGNLFYQLGLWVAQSKSPSEGNQVGPIASGPTTEIAQADFELGPMEDENNISASAEEESSADLESEEESADDPFDF